MKRNSSLWIALAVLTACAGVANAELLDNGDFESGMSGWAGYGCGSGWDGVASYYDWGTLASIKSTGGVDNSAYIETSPHRENKDPWWGWSQIWTTGANIVTVSDGDPVTVNFMAKQQNDLNGYADPNSTLVMSWTGDNWTGDPNNYDSFIFSVTSDWTAKSFVATAPAGATELQIRFHLGSGDSLGIDNVDVCVGLVCCDTYALSDINSDCVVDVLDLVILSQEWLVNCEDDWLDPACL